MALVKSLDLIARERNTVGRERARGQYGAAEYVGAKLLAELPLDAAFQRPTLADLAGLAEDRILADVGLDDLDLDSASSAG